MLILVMEEPTTVHVLAVPHTILHTLPIMTTIVNQVYMAILNQVKRGTWTIPFRMDRVITPPPIAVTTAI